MQRSGEAACLRSVGRLLLHGEREQTAADRRAHCRRRAWTHAQREQEDEEEQELGQTIDTRAAHVAFVEVVLYFVEVLLL